MLLMCAVIFGFTMLNRPSEAELAERQRIQDSIAAVQKQTQAANKPLTMLTPDEVQQLQAVMTEHGDSANRGIDDGACPISFRRMQDLREHAPLAEIAALRRVPRDAVIGEDVYIYDLKRDS